MFLLCNSSRISLSLTWTLFKRSRYSVFLLRHSSRFSSSSSISSSTHTSFSLYWATPFTVSAILNGEKSRDHDYARPFDIASDIERLSIGGGDVPKHIYLIRSFSNSRSLSSTRSLYPILATESASKSIVVIPAPKSSASLRRTFKSSRRCWRKT